MDAAFTDNLGLTEHPFNFHVEQMLWAWSAALFSLKPKLSKLKIHWRLPHGTGTKVYVLR